MARRVAERLAAGQLQERLRVTGEDDLARLATSFNQMATNLQRQIRQLEELSRVQRRFVSDVSHELRTPLTTVRLAGAVLHDAQRRLRPRGPARRRAAADASSTASRPCWSTCSRSAGSTPARPRSTSTTSTSPTSCTGSSTAPRALADAAQHPGRGPRARARRASPRPTYAGWSGSCATSSPTPSTTPRASEIVVTVAADEQAAAIAVRDHGVGLAVGESAMVFNRFWRADPARARTSGGTGLGPGDLARGHPPARRLAAGLGQAARGRAVPAHPAPPRRAPAAPQPAPARARRRRGGGGVSRRVRRPGDVVGAWSPRPPARA